MISAVIPSEQSQITQTLIDRVACPFLVLTYSYNHYSNIDNSVQIFRQSDPHSILCMIKFISKWTASCHEPTSVRIFWAVSFSLIWTRFRFGEDVAVRIKDSDFGTIKTSWAVLLYQLAVIGYLVFLVTPDSYRSEDIRYAIEVRSPWAVISQSIEHFAFYFGNL